MVMKIEVIIPAKIICKIQADEVILPGLTGQIGILKGHAALITGLETGLLRIKLNGKWTPIILSGGLAEIKNDEIVVLTNYAEEVVGVKLEEATKKLENVAASLENAQTSKERLDASLELKKAMARLEAINFLS